MNLCKATSMVLTCVIGVCLPAAATAQLGSVQVQGSRIPAIPARDRPQRFGTATIKGRVVDGATGAAIARARVRISGPSGQRPSVMTDGSGAFAFANLPAGGYSLVVEKSTYLTGRFPAPGRTMRAAAGRPLIVRDGEALDAVTVPLYRGAAITGRVLDAHGDPVEHADVRVVRLSSAGARPMNVGGSSTNDLGEFRVARLEAGRYLLMVAPRRMMSPDEPVPDGPPPPQPLPTYYPGGAAIDQAQPITLERGQTVSGLEILLAEGTPAVLTGSVVTARGEPVGTGAFVNARAIVKDFPFSFDPSGGASVGADGTFRLTLPPGEYRIEAHVNQRTQDGPARPENQLFGGARVSLAPGGGETVTIVVGLGATASGRIVFEGTSQIPSTPGQFRPQFFTSETGECRAGQTQIGADWTFRVEGLGGTCSAPSFFGVAGWMLKSILYEGNDLLDRTVTFEPGQDLRDVQIVLTDKRTEITLRVADEQGQATRDYVALVFPASKERRGQMRYVRTFVPPSVELMAVTALGRGAPSASLPGTPAGAPPPVPEAIRGLPPGEYYAVAVDDVETDAVRDAAFLERLVPSATRVSLSEGGAAEVVLRRLKIASR